MQISLVRMDRARNSHRRTTIHHSECDGNAATTAVEPLPGFRLIFSPTIFQEGRSVKRLFGRGKYGKNFLGGSRSKEHGVNSFFMRGHYTVKICGSVSAFFLHLSRSLPVSFIPLRLVLSFRENDPVPTILKLCGCVSGLVLWVAKGVGGRYTVEV